MKANKVIQAPEGESACAAAMAGARDVLSAQVDDAVRLSERLLAIDTSVSEIPEDIVSLVHRVRVSSRRAEAAIRGLGWVAKSSRARRARRRLRRLRTRVGSLRAAQVHLHTLAELRGDCPRGHGSSLEVACLLCRHDVQTEWKSLCSAIDGGAVKSPRKAIKELVRSWKKRVGGEAGSDASWARTVAEGLTPALEKVRRLAGQTFGSIDDLHAIRIAGKKLRYALEVFKACRSDVEVEPSINVLKELQVCLGSINDLAGLADRIGVYAHTAEEQGREAPARRVQDERSGQDEAGEERSLSGQLDGLHRWVQERLNAAIDEFKRTWPSKRQTLLEAFDALKASLPTQKADRRAAPHSNGEVSRRRDDPRPGLTNGAMSVDVKGVKPERTAIKAELRAAVAPAADGQYDRLAALDIGTNSIRLVIAEVRPDGTYRVLDDEKDTTRLGSGLVTTGRLSPAAMDQAIEAVGRMNTIAQGYGVKWFRAVGTCAVREAENSGEFIKRMKREAGVDLEVISAEAEARLAHLSVGTAFDLSGIDAAVVDIGGGSTEIVLSSRGVIEHVYSLMLGTVGLTEEHGLAVDDGDGIPERRFRRMRAQVRDAMKRLIGKPPILPQTVFGTGGTFTALASVALLRHEQTDGDWGPLNVRGYDLNRPTLKHLLHWLRGMSSQERARVNGLSAERADIIVAGAAIVDAVLGRLGSNAVRVHDRGIRDGLLLQMIKEHLPNRAGAAVPEVIDPVRSFARACNYEVDHSEHVTKLALEAYDQFAEALNEPWMTPGARRLLEAASVLHDVGYYINYAKHHKHSYHLILHSELAGFTHREIAIVANVARYHRRSAPKRSHANFSSLPKADRVLVRQLAGILRIVDGLDRAHGQHVRRVEVDVRPDEVRFKVHAKFEPVVDIWGAQRKSKLLESTLGRKVRFSWTRILSEQSSPSEAPQPALVG